MLLSESEKNRIKGLYGLITENESVLSFVKSNVKSKLFKNIIDVFDRDNINPSIEVFKKMYPNIKIDKNQIKNIMNKFLSVSDDQKEKMLDSLMKKGLNEQSEFQEYLKILPGFLLGLFLIHLIMEPDLITKNTKKYKDNLRKLEEMEKQWQEQDKKRKEEEQKKREEELQRELEVYRKQAEQERKKEEELEAKKEEENKVFEDLIGKTVNLYNDNTQQILYGEIIIKKLRFNPLDKGGGRSSIAVYTLKDFYDDYSYEIICLSNPDRLAPYVVEKGEYSDDLKYNKSFVDAVKKRAGNFCQKPKADFGSVNKSDGENLV